MTPRRITSKAELRGILEKVGSQEISVEDAFQTFDLTIRANAVSVAEWMEKKARDIRAANPE